MTSKRNFGKMQDKYLSEVLSGKLPVGRMAKLAVQRFADYLDSPPPGYRFDTERADRICRWVELFPHVEGSWKTPNIQLDPWQVTLLRNLFGFVDADGRRMFSRAFLLVPRKSAKTTLSATVILYLLCADGEAGPRCYAAATTREQARLVAETAKKMVRKSPGLQKQFGITITGGVTQAGKIVAAKGDGEFMALSADHHSLDGLNISGCVVDEFAQHPNNLLYSVLDTATGARRQPLLWSISTAGYNQQSPCFQQQQYCEKVLRGEIDDKTTFALIHGADPDDDWKSPDTWRKAHPALGTSMLPAQMERMAKEAIGNPQGEVAFRTKMLNQWQDAAAAWISLEVFDSCRHPDAAVCDPESGWRNAELRTAPLWIGIDLSSRRDLTALCYLWRLSSDKFLMKHRYFLPEDGYKFTGNQDMRRWSGEGWLETTVGAQIHQPRILELLKADAAVYNLQSIGYDEWQADFIAVALAEAGIEVVKFPHTVANISPAMKMTDALLADGQLLHDGNPITRMCFGNVVAREDRKREIFPRKENDTAKIDGAMSAIMAVGLSQIAVSDEDGGGWFQFA